MENEIKDDGSLACLNIPRNADSRSFNCDVITQSKLCNREFYVLDYIEDVPTRYSKQEGKGQMLVKIKFKLTDADSDARKFFTGSPDIIYICQRLREMDKFPRRVTMRGSGNRFWFE